MNKRYVTRQGEEVERIFVGYDTYSRVTLDDGVAGNMPSSLFNALFERVEEVRE